MEKYLRFLVIDNWLELEKKTNFNNLLFHSFCFTCDCSSNVYLMLFWISKYSTIMTGGLISSKVGVLNKICGYSFRNSIFRPQLYWKFWMLQAFIYLLTIVRRLIESVYMLEKNKSFAGWKRMSPCVTVRVTRFSESAGKIQNYYYFSIAFRVSEFFRI